MLVVEVMVAAVGGEGSGDGGGGSNERKVNSERSARFQSKW